MQNRHHARLLPSSVLLTHEAAAGVILMAASAIGMLCANSTWQTSYEHWLNIETGPLTVRGWINDALMALFFLLAGLEIKREILYGHLSHWSQRLLPGVAAIGGMVVPATIYVAFNHSGEALRGWAIPTATDIAFALGVLALAGSRVPAILKVFLTALAIVDDLGAVLVIALFYTGTLSVLPGAGVVAILGLLLMLNRQGVRMLFPYLLAGVPLWWLTLKSGIHPTVAGVGLALLIPAGHDEASPLMRLEHMLSWPVRFVILPLFGFANAGISLHGVTVGQMLSPLTLGVGAALMLGKPLGVLGAVSILQLSGASGFPPYITWRHRIGIAFLCGIGFTMSLFIAILAFPGTAAVNQIKLGILSGSMLSGLCGYILLRGPAVADR
ncbi:Na+/H+ antiporter nhaA [Granulibacter bethesdensis]|uniref:Na(+)/H(+) antiporter NhaA n=1 Tax=Granulibacter bethesdensis TaxID=364410 RepID=A0AAN0RDL7_9PROT|nr:Na+/H+ antiporter NhaA [Granulibacter bethesdensis]AHJ63000.1 Na+/H+ antiporter nhaA [Granulibacter bethesdensis]